MTVFERFRRWYEAEPIRWRLAVHFPLAVQCEVLGWVAYRRPGMGPIVYFVHEVTQWWDKQTRHSLSWHFLDWLPSVPASALVGLTILLWRLAHAAP